MKITVFFKPTVTRRTAKEEEDEECSSHTHIPVKMLHSGKASFKEMEIKKDNVLACKLCGKRKTSIRKLKYHMEKHTTNRETLDHADQAQEPGLQIGNLENLNKGFKFLL